MQNPSNKVSYPLLRKGERFSIYKVPDEFTIRTEKGVNDLELSQAFDCNYKESFNKQNLSVLSVRTTERDAVMDRMRSAEEVDFASHVYALENDPLARIYLTDELTVQFKQETTQEQIEKLMNDLGLNFVKSLDEAAHCYAFRLTSASRMNPLKMAALMDKMPETDFVEANIGIKSMSFYTPSDNFFGMQWHLHHGGGIQLAEGAHVDAKRAWDITRGDRSVVVAVADDSVDLDHVDFQGTGKVVAPRDFKGFDFNPSPVAASDNHGTSCAGVAVAEENGQGVVGIAPACSLMPIRTTGILDDNSIEALFEWAVDKGAAVISNSWGPSSVNFPLSFRQDRAIRKAATEGRDGKGCVICFAAGNANRPVNDTVDEQNWPDRVLNGAVRWFNGYAAHPNVITVAACTSLNRKSAYSSWGNEISVCAPSNNAHPVFGRGITYPELSGSFPGRGIVTADRVGPLGYSSSDYTSSFGGTSSACPLVAGIAALVLSANPALTAQEVREILESTADKIVDNSTDPQLGLAFGDYDENGHSQWFGYGKVNAFKAVQEAVRRLGENNTTGSSLLEVKSTKSLSIPDNQEDGVESTIEVEQLGLLKNISVQLKIQHTYIGDLQVTLAAPSGKRVVLHSRTGGSKNDIDEVYTLSNTAGLMELAGESISGQWTLFIQDLAAQDTGQLENWAMTLAYEDTTNQVVLEEGPGQTIPDSDPNGLIRTLNNPTSGTLKGIAVDVDISHSYIADLIIELVAPNGQRIILHNRAGGSSDNIQTTYNISSLSTLDQLVGIEGAGDWQLHVKDLASQDTGKLNKWAVRIDLE
jgi:subtilisin-like proprotein convertase family protein/subtilisin family serine protease